MELFVVDGPGNLLDLEILSPETHDTPSVLAPALLDVDPAILSYGKAPFKKQDTESAAPKSLNLDPTMPIQVRQTLVPRQRVPISTAIPGGGDQATAQQCQESTSATLTGPFEDLSINGFKRVEARQNRDTGRQKQEETMFKMKNKRRGKGRGNNQPAEVKEYTAPQRVPIQKELGPKPNGQIQRTRGPGWRETPLLEEATRPKAQHLHPQDGSGTRKLSRRELKLRAKMEKSGWATEDATDIQEMGDFDFSGNLSKFDKRGVFDQLKQEDTTADEERLVSFNRLPPRAGTAGGKNLHFTENVLDSPRVESRAWSSGDSEADGSAARFSSGRSSRRNLSRVSARQPPSRKGSTVVTDQHGTGSGSLQESKARARWASRGPSGNSKPARDISSSRDTAMPHLPTSAKTKPSLRIVSSDQLCPCLTPLQMLELEQLAINEHGMTEELMSENASRSIAETASRLIHPMSELSNKNTNGPGPVVVVLAGNTKSGARSIAGARQLRNHGARVMVTILGLEREDDLLDVVRRQLALYENCGGRLTQPSRLNKTLKSLHAKPDITIDALLGMHLSFDDLRTEDQETYFELANWANNSAHVMAIDVPSGVDASSGMEPLML